MNGNPQLELIGKGGMAEVYAGYDRILEKNVAVKIPAAHLDKDEQHQLWSEAGRMAKVGHENVLQIYRLEMDSGSPRLVMELADGGTLLRRLSRGSIPAPEAAEILRQLLRGLGAVHDSGIIHRDIKPGNILICGGVYKIGDFGIAKTLDEKTSPYITWKYAAPECVGGGSATEAADIYSLGVVAYEMLLGEDGFRRGVQQVWRGSSPQGAPPTNTSDTATPWHMWQIERTSLPAPHAFVPGIPEHLSRVVEGMCQKDPALRYQSCHQILAALDSVIGSAAPRPDPPTIPSGPVTEKVPEPGAVPPSPPVSSPSVSPPPLPPPPVSPPPVSPPPVSPPPVSPPPVSPPPVAPTPVVSAPAVSPVSPGNPEHIQWGMENHSKPAPPTGTRDRRLWWLTAAVVVLAVVCVVMLFLQFRGGGSVPWGGSKGGRDSELRNLRARALERVEAGDFAAALTDLEAVLREDPDDTEAALASAKAQYRLNDYDAAKGLLDKLKTSDAENREVWLHLGLIDLAREQFSDAVAHLERATELGGDEHPDTHFYLGFAYYRNQDWTDARDEFERFLDSAPEDSPLVPRARSFLDRLSSVGTLGAPGAPRSAYEKTVSLQGFRRANVRFESFRGDVVLVHFWASWCAPCLEEMPRLVRFFEEDYPRLQDDGLQLVTISNDYTEKALTRFVDKELGSASRRLPIYWDPNARLSEVLRLDRNLPQTLIIDRDGRVSWERARVIDWQDRDFVDLLRARL